MSGPRVGVLHAPHGAATLRDIYVAASGLCDVVMLFREPVAVAQPETVAAARRLFPVQIVAEAADLRPLALDGLVAFHDGELDAADRFASELGLPGAPELPGPWDKLVQRMSFVEHCGSRIRAVPVDSVDDLDGGVREVGFPCVLKPRRGASGAGIAFLDDPADVAFQRRERRRWSGLLVEAAMRPGRHPSGPAWLGDYVSVETVSDGTGRQHVAIFDKVPVSVARRAGPDGSDVVNTAGDLTPSRLSTTDQSRVLQRTDAALDALDVRWRVTHTELWVHADGVEVIEVNGRVGGHLTRLLRLVGGCDLVRAALTVAAGLSTRPPPGRAGYAAGLFLPFPLRSGVVRSRVSRAELRRLPGVVGVEEVAAYGESRATNGFRVANLTLFAADVDRFDDEFAATVAGLATLFARDGLAHDPWIRQLALASTAGAR